MSRGSLLTWRPEPPENVIVRSRNPALKLFFLIKTNLRNFRFKIHLWSLGTKTLEVSSQHPNAWCGSSFVTYCIFIKSWFTSHPVSVFLNMSAECVGDIAYSVRQQPVGLASTGCEFFFRVFLTYWLKFCLICCRYKSGVRSVRSGGGAGGAEEARRGGLKALPKRARTRCRGMNMGQKLSGGVKVSVVKIWCRPWL